jgi:hypothetical protein
MQPVFLLSGSKLEVGATDAERREAIGEWVTSPENPWFAKALVNRIWAELVGEGFYEPVDDLGPDRTCSAPETMDLLATAFVESGYDVKWLLRTIVATEAYQRESRPRRLPDAPPFMANCVQPLRADQLYDALVDVLGVGELERSGPARGPGGLYARLRGPRGVFGEVFGFDPSNPRDEVAGSIPQALALMNSPGIARAIEGEGRGTMLSELLTEIPDDKQLVQELYLRSLVREPNREELAACLSHVRHAENRTAGFEDVLWSLINSTEFQHRH